MSAPKVNHRDAANTILNPVSKRDTAENRRLTDLRNTDKCVRPNDIDAASESVKLCDGLVASASKIDNTDRSGAGFSDP